MSFSSRRDAAPVFAAISCSHCHRLDVPCLLPAGTRTCTNCVRLRRPCRISRGRDIAARRFRTRVENLRTALSSFLGALDSIDLHSSDSSGVFLYAFPSSFLRCPDDDRFFDPC
jgi:hypothetical protein